MLSSKSVPNFSNKVSSYLRNSNLKVTVLIQQLLCTDKALQHEQSHWSWQHNLPARSKASLLPQYFTDNTLFPFLTPLKIFWHAYAKQRGGNYHQCMLWDYNIERFYFTFLFLYSYCCILTTMVFSFVIIICNALNSFHVLKNCHCLLQQRNWFCLQVLSAIDYSGSNCFLDVFWSSTLIFTSESFSLLCKRTVFH